jgi:Tfp pilus assembly protein PilN
LQAILQNKLQSVSNRLSLSVQLNQLSEQSGNINQTALSKDYTTVKYLSRALAADFVDRYQA